MTKEQTLKAIRQAKMCFAVILLHKDDTRYIKVSKKELIYAVEKSPDNVEYLGRMIDGDLYFDFPNVV